MSSISVKVILAAVILVILFAVMIVRSSIEQSRKLKTKIRNSWGVKTSQLFSVRFMGEVRKLFDSVKDHESDRVSVVDDISAHDLDLDRLYGLMDHSMSSAGDEILYLWIRRNSLRTEELAEREKLITLFAENEEVRWRVREIFARVGRISDHSFFGLLSLLDQAEVIGKSRYLFLSILTLSGFAMLFIAPLAGLAVLIPALFLDFRLHLSMKAKTAPYLKGFLCILMLAEAGEKIRQIKEPSLERTSQELSEILSKFQRFRRESIIALSGASEGSGIGDAILEYLKMFFHIDLISFDSMLRAAKERKADSIRLLEILGTLDAAQGIASWRATLDQWCRPEFLTIERHEIKIAGLVHPALTEAVANSFSSKGCMLITGSNASGKSTFLKAAAIAAIMAQSVNTVTADKYMSPPVRVYSSMALSDDLTQGESYFVVEIKSLKRIFDASKRDDYPVLCVIDEVLRGTNTIERIAASSEILMEMSRGRSFILAATHDIELTYLLELSYANYHFAEDVLDGDVRFDYRIREGRAVSRNAIRLLSEVRFPDHVVKAAEECARRFESSGEWLI